MPIKIHGERVRSGKRSPEYITWDHMKGRCLRKNHVRYKDYGGRGITVCDRWLLFQNFLEDMGRKPSPSHTIDRIDNNGNYEPGNCRWATVATQQSNRRDNAKITFVGKTLTISEWSRELGIPITTISLRIKRGLPVEQILTQGHLKPNRITEP
jgi:hypothetical protein